tara:strand:- start:2562 stop:3272 length:711 start_codon:yes stop_codon:yes gene_type:complete
MLEADSRLLRAMKIFDGLEVAAIEAFSSQCRTLRYRKGRQILGQQDDTNDVFFVIEGTVHLVGYSGSGKVVSFGDIGPGGIIGEFSAIDGLPRSVSVTALTDCELARTGSTVFRNFLSNQPGAALKVLEAIVAKTRSINDRVFEYSTLSVDNRLHAELLRLAEMNGLEKGAPGRVTVISPAPTHQEIAMRISTHREAVTRELNRLATEGILGLSRRRIELRDPDALRGILAHAQLE